MGSEITANLVQAGHEAVVWTRSADEAEALAGAGATHAEPPAEAAPRDQVMTMLADDRAVEEVVFGEGGMAGAPALHVGHSTISVTLADWLAAETGAGGYISAPVLAVRRAPRRASCPLPRRAPKAALDCCEPVLLRWNSGDVARSRRP